ncbi:DinB family protein [Flavobacterium sp.]|jgi:hypothetical protein|uniref:DinB family protein n=1 Tax=Flavobacterium sp. TaxID=239 RepID=UPI0022C7CDD6|nr:DinB family protein [Flavobacterium sp.]MCZ8146058.1 DinB family protein [Flavobacterium sp.]MCZ8167973.1 DinB family protein [Flavobacterium sp.]MCZ8367598.1 DinB family protein [Flavobacterium sp.]
MRIEQVQAGEYGDFYAPYLAQVDPQYSLVEELEIALHRFIHFVREIPMDKFDYRYAEGKWTIKEIIQHIIDAERVFAYRAMRIARHDQTPLPGFDENDYVAASNGNERSIQDLLTEFSTLRHATIYMFKSFKPEYFERKGMASKHPITVRALGFIIIGHQNHHHKVFQQRYL